MITVFVKKCVCLVFVLSIILTGLRSSTVIIVAKDKKEKVLNYKQGVGKTNAKKVAEFHIESLVEKKKERGKWNKKPRIKKEIPLYDNQKKICAYVFELSNGNEDAGYVIVGNNEQYAPVIEYSTSGRFWEGELKDSEYIIYDGSLGYYKASDDSKVVTDIHNKDLKYKKNYEKKKRSNHTEEWAALEMQAEQYWGESTPPHTDDSPVITNTENYESGYISRSSKYVPSYSYVKYFTVNDFPETGNCVPVAGLNLLLYWHERKFFDLVYGTWQDTYYKLYSYFGTGPKGTSNLKNVKNGLDKYLFEKGVQTGITHYWDSDDTSWNEMKYRLDFGEPFIYVVSDNCIYDDHAVLALGYVEYTYSSVQFYTESKYSRYLCLADGWTPYADRYVNIDVGNAISQDEMITLYFVGK